MKLRKEARILESKALASLRRSLTAFNSFEEEGRATSVLLHLQHAFEMLLKAGLVQARVAVFDRDLGRAVGFEKCVNLGAEHLTLTDEEMGTLRAIDALRDDEQHWFNHVAEGILYSHCRAGVTLFDDILVRCFDHRLTDYLPVRVLPVSAEPPQDIQLLIDAEYRAIAELLAPGKRRHSEAQARIRALLALEAHVVEDVRVSNKDVRRVERAVSAGKGREQVFPRLASIVSEVAGEGVSISVRFSKKKGAPVTFVDGDDPAEAAAIREVDLQKKYYMSTSELAERVGMTLPKCLAVRNHLAIDDDESCRHVFEFGSQRIPRYSDNALTKIKRALDDGLDVGAVWRGRNG